MADTEKSTSVPQRSSPHKPTVVGTEQHTFIEPKLEEKRAKMCIELSGHFVGEMPVKELLDTFLPLSADKAATLPKGDFSAVPFDKTEKDMYEPIATAINNSGCCPSFELYDTHKVKDKDTALGPDLMLFSADEYEAATQDKQYFARVEVIVEVKPSSQDDAFVSQANDRNAVKTQANKVKNQPNLAAVTEKGFMNRGQQIDYAIDVMTLQHRTHIFTISIIGRKARILLWDRSGTIVSKAFDYVEDDSLTEFFYRYGHATREHRGHDTSVVNPSKNEAKKFRKAVREYVKGFPKDDPLFDLHQSLDTSRAVRKLRVYDDASKTTSEYVVCKPFFDPMSMIGRGTRGYLAWGINEQRLVFVKDSWRTDLSDVSTELDIYALLLRKPSDKDPQGKPTDSNDGAAAEAHGHVADDKSKNDERDKDDSPLPHLPIILKSGDVQDANGDIQITKAQDHLSNKNQWARPTGWIRRHVHIRIVQELLLPLHMVQNSKQLVQVIRDVLELIRRAHNDRRILHRDISFGNIMLDKAFRGILNDWDHAIEVPRQSNAHPYRTGTWQFMSIAILKSPTKMHEVHDDIESCFWVLLSTAVKFFKITSDPFDLTILDESKEKIINRQVYVTGGQQKRGALSDDIPKLVFASRPLSHAISGFARILTQYHSAKEAVHDNKPKAKPPTAGDAKKESVARTRDEEEEDEDEEEEASLNKKKFERRWKGMRRVHNILKVLDEALAMEDWPENDAVKNQHPKQSALDVRKATHQLKETEFVRSQQELLKLSWAEQTRSYPDRPFPASEQQNNIFPPARSFTMPPPPVLPQHASPMVSQSSIGEKRRQPDEPTENEDEDRGEGSSNGRLQRSRSPTKRTKTETKKAETKAPGAKTRKSSSRKPSAERSRQQTRSQDRSRTSVQPGSSNQEGVRTRAQVKKSLSVDRVRTRSQSKELGLLN